MTIAERMKAVRAEAKLKQKEFADSILVSVDAVSMMERGVMPVSPRTIAMTCEKYNVSKDWLENGEGEMHVLPLDDDADLVDELMKLGEGHATKEIVKALLKLYLSLPDEKKNIIDKAFETAIEATKKDPE